MKSVKVGTLDTIFSKCIRESYDWICAYKDCKYCNNVSFRDNHGGLHNSHFKGRRKRSTRWFPPNCYALCNKRHEHMGENHDDHYKWVIGELGMDGYDDLVLRSNETKKYTPHDRWEMNKHYNEQYKYALIRRKKGYEGYLPLIRWD